MVRTPLQKCSFCRVRTAVLMVQIFILGVALVRVVDGQQTRESARSEEVQSQRDTANSHGASDGKQDGETDNNAPKLLKLTDDVFVGAQPTADYFATLAARGIRTIVSVDGASPAVAEAARHGIAYVHVPIGYDGISRTAALSFIQVARQAKRPIFVHCHHGRHRGPAAAAVIGMACGRIDGKGATDFLTKAGTGAQYQGLWRDVKNFQMPMAASPSEWPKLQSQAEVDSFTATMVAMERTKEHLELCRAANWQTPASHPDLALAHELTIMGESFREAIRFADSSRAGKTEDTQAQTHEPELASAMLRELRASAALVLRMQQSAAKLPATNAMLESQFAKLSENCRSCHATFRN